MCFEDIAVARATKTNIYRTVSSSTIPANANRISIKVVCPDLAAVELYLVKPRLANSPTVTDVLIAWATRALGGSLVDQPTFTAFDTAYLSIIGSAFLGPLTLTSVGALGTVFAIESYLDIETPLSKYIPKGQQIGG